MLEQAKKLISEIYSDTSREKSARRDELEELHDHCASLLSQMDKAPEKAESPESSDNDGDSDDV